MLENKLKVCYTCKELKEKSEFNKNSGRKDGLQSICKVCSALRSRKYYSENIESHKKAAMERKKQTICKNQQFVFNYQKLNGCIECKENDPACLDFDHVSGVKTKSISQMVKAGTCFSTILNEIKKCVIRCANCHRKKTAKDFNWYKNIET